MPRTEFYCFHVIGALRLLFSVQSRSSVSSGRGKYLLEANSEPRGLCARVLGMTLVSGVIPEWRIHCLSLPHVSQLWSLEGRKVSSL